MKRTVLLLLTVAVLFNCKKDDEKKEASKDVKSDKIETTNSINKKDSVNESESNNAIIAENNLPEDLPTLNSNPVVISPNGIQANSDGTYKFQFNLEVGKSYPMKVTTDVKTTATDGKQTINESTKSEQHRVFEVLERRGSNYIIKVKDISRSEKMTMVDGTTISYNTKAGKPNREELAFNYEVAKLEEKYPITIEMNPLGQVLSVSGLKERKEKVLVKFKEQINNDEQFKQVKQGIESTYTEQMVRAELEQNLAGIHPKKPLKVGEKWSDSDSKSEGGNSITFQQNYELKSVENNQVTITSNGTIKTKGSQSKDGLSMFSNGTQTSNGKVIFNQESGWIKNISLNQKDVTKETLEFQGQKQNRTVTTNTKIRVN